MQLVKDGKWRREISSFILSPALFNLLLLSCIIVNNNNYCITCY